MFTKVNGRILKIEILANDGFRRFTVDGNFIVNLRLIEDTDSITVVEFYKRGKASQKTQTLYHYTTYFKSDIKRIDIYTEEVE